MHAVDARRNEKKGEWSNQEWQVNSLVTIPKTYSLLLLTGAMILSLQSELLQFSWPKFMVKPFIPLHGFTLSSCFLLPGNCRLDCSPYFDRVHLNRALEFNVAMHQARLPQDFFSQKYIRSVAQPFIGKCAPQEKWTWQKSCKKLMAEIQIFGGKVSGRH